MPSLYTENSEKWIALADIDYFTQYVKAWIPFNAWYKNYYPALNSDRDIINEIKSTPNSFRDRLESLLQGTGTENDVFKSHVANLHHELGRKLIRHKQERVSFEFIIVERNPNKLERFTRNNITYSAERGPNGRTEKEIQITVSGIRLILSHTQTNGYDLDDLRNQEQFNRLSVAQKTNLEACYKEINPYKPVNLLTGTPEDCIQIGRLMFANDYELVCKGIIEVLYILRNLLFHGEIVPDKDTKKIYEPAYHILRELIQTL